MKNGHYTTGDIAKLLGVASRTVCKWCDSGLLKCHAIPGGGKQGAAGHRRISQTALEAFLARHPDFPAPESLRTARPAWIDAGAAEVALRLSLPGWAVDSDERDAFATEVAKIMDRHRLAYSEKSG